MYRYRNWTLTSETSHDVTRLETFKIISKWQSEPMVERSGKTLTNG